MVKFLIFKILGLNWKNQTAGLFLKVIQKCYCKALICWGRDKTLKAINGQFAFAFWDQQEKELLLVRDRLGIKPLYWADSSKGLVFGSEINAILKMEDIEKKINMLSFEHYLTFGYSTRDESIFDHVHKLQPGFWAVFKNGKQIEEHQYWSIEDSFDHEFQGNHEEIGLQLESLLEDAVKIRQISDVPLGVFLSGGVDSSLVASLMRSTTSERIQSFSIGFDNPDYDESVGAKKIAQHLNLDHHEWILSEKDCLAVIPKMMEIYDEPFADVSQIPTYLVSKMARKHVTVALSGDGGDEGVCWI